MGFAHEGHSGPEDDGKCILTCVSMIPDQRERSMGNRELALKAPR